MWKLIGTTLLCISLMGCLFVVDSKQKAGRTQWHQDDRSQLVSGQTSADWVREAFGPPDRRSVRDDGSEVWRYRNTRSKETEIGMFLLFNIDVSSDEEETLIIEMRDGVVADHWVERR
ncbi:MAG: hypothetical protein Q7W55_06055 [Pseudohongiella sp.]|nr:hypothetical protein [Pseudohongiella sp.]MDO9521577.1 hypothetical protein [Pseudohongiella sp.]MDP2127804.1 hypothetical protein [Pseudohongiella sp.]